MMGPEHEHMLRSEALTEALDQAAQESTPLELPQDMRYFVLREMENVFRLGLTDEPPPLVSSIALRWKPAACAAKVKP